MLTNDLPEEDVDIIGWQVGRMEEASFSVAGESRDYRHGDYIAVNAPIYSIVSQSQISAHQIPDYSQTLCAINESLSALRSEISDLAKVVQALEGRADRPATKTLAIHGLQSKKYSLRKPLFATLEDYGEEIVARLPEYDLYASGESEAEAIALLQQEIVGLYEDLNESEDELGGLPASWLRDLGDYIEDRELRNG